MNAIMINKRRQTFLHLLVETHNSTVSGLSKIILNTRAANKPDDKFNCLTKTWIMAAAEENTQSNTDLSFRLSRVLDEVELSDIFLNKRRQTYLKIEKLESIACRLRGVHACVYYFGSQAEGTTTQVLNSDLDRMTCLTDINVIQDLHDWTIGKVNSLVLQGGDIPAGYCRLQYLVKQDGRLRDTDVLGYYMVRDNEDRLIMTHNIIQSPHINKPYCSRHGPAITFFNIDGTADNDMVPSLKCDNVSQQVTARLEQLKGKPWPTVDMLKTAEETGFFVVPVGHRLSETRELEWRVTPSLAEKCFMLGMNNTQVKCYVVLKMIKKDMIVPKIGESITSFHLKNTLFHCVEHTEHEFWTEANLLTCLHTCLERLLVYVESKCCPNFLIPGENLFSGRISEIQFISLKKLLEKLLQSDGRCLFDIKCDDVGTKLLGNVDLNHSSNFTVDPVGFVKYEVKPTITVHALKDTFCRIWPSGSNLTEWTKELIQKVKEVKIMSPDTDITSDMTTLFLCLHSTHGSLLASMCIRNGLPVSDEARASLKQGLESDLMSGKLKYASVHFCAGELAEVDVMLEELERDYDHNVVQGVCYCDIIRHMKPAFCQRVSAMGDDAHVQKLAMMALHVGFTLQEIDCCPFPMRFEMFRALSDDEKMRTPGLDDWMSLAVVDAVVFLHFLRYMTYRASGNHQLRRMALDNLLDCITQEARYIIHADTAFNLLGQCCEMEGRVNAALKCFASSLKLRPRNNAANWLLPLTLYRYFSQQCPL